MRYLSFLILMLPLFAFSQGDKYRMQASLGFHSTMYYGTRSFNNVTRSVDPSFMYYEQETYQINYKNFTFSAGFNFKLSLNWINNNDFILRQNSAVFADIYEEQLTYTLTDFVVGDTSVFPNPSFQHDFNIGDGRTVTLNGLGFGLIQEILYLQKLKSDWNIGGGVSFNWMQRNDGNFRPDLGFNNYDPNYCRLYYGKYNTQQLGVVFQAEKLYERWTIYVSLNQTVYTAKSRFKKGGEYYKDGFLLYPISHNLDFRFPLLIQFGAAIQFGKIKR